MSNRIGPRHLVVAGFLFLLPTVIIVLTQGNSGYDTERGVTRFLNAFLTSYTIASVFFVVNMFQYSKSREEPTAPWVSMVYAATLGIFVTFLLTNQGGIPHGREWLAACSNTLQHRSLYCNKFCDSHGSRHPNFALLRQSQIKG